LPPLALVEREPHRAVVAVQLDEPSAEPELLVSSVAGRFKMSDALAELLLRGLDQAIEIDLRVCAFRYRRSCRLVHASSPALRLTTDCAFGFHDCAPTHQFGSVEGSKRGSPYFSSVVSSR